MNRQRIRISKSETNSLYNTEDDEEIIEIDHPVKRKPCIKPIVKNDRNQKIIVRKKQLMDRLDSQKLTYVRGGICDSFIKYGFPSLEKVISDVEEMTKQEEQRLMNLITELKKIELRYDSRVSYYKEYVEQGTHLKTAIREGKKEWFYINMTDYLELVDFYKDEDMALTIALDRYIDTHGYDEYVKKYIGVNYREMKLHLF